MRKREGGEKLGGKETIVLKRKIPRRKVDLSQPLGSLICHGGFSPHRTGAAAAQAQMAPFKSTAPGHRGLTTCGVDVASRSTLAEGGKVHSKPTHNTTVFFFDSPDLRGHLDISLGSSDIWEPAGEAKREKPGPVTCLCCVQPSSDPGTACPSGIRASILQVRKQ